METFTPDELAYLDRTKSLGRLATVGRDGMPHVVPVGWSLGADRQAIEIGGIELARTKKFRDIRRTARAALVIDEVQPPWQPRGVEVRGRAEALPGPEALIRLHPERIIAWGFEGATGARDVARRRAERPRASVEGRHTPGHMHAVVRRSSYEPDALAAATADMAEFDRAHRAQPGYAGSAVIDLGEGERIMMTLWQSAAAAAVARTTLGPVVQRLLGPLERTPSRLVGVGPVIATDLALSSPGESG